MSSGVGDASQTSWVHSFRCSSRALGIHALRTGASKVGVLGTHCREVVALRLSAAAPILALGRPFSHSSVLGWAGFTQTGYLLELGNLGNPLQSFNPHTPHTSIVRNMPET
eukprot:6491405-Amphidinium_carterae.1